MESPALTTSRSPTDDEDADRKATLFCPGCGHASSLDGDWEIRMVANNRRVRCPDCRHVVDERQATDRRPARADSIDAAVDRCVDVWNRYWSTWTTLFTGGQSAETDC